MSAAVVMLGPAEPLAPSASLAVEVTGPDELEVLVEGQRAAATMAAHLERTGYSAVLDVVLGRGYRVRTSATREQLVAATASVPWVRHGAVISFVQRAEVAS